MFRKKRVLKYGNIEFWEKGVKIKLRERERDGEFAYACLNMKINNNDNEMIGNLFGIVFSFVFVFAVVLPIVISLGFIVPTQISTTYKLSVVENKRANFKL